MSKIKNEIVKNLIIVDPISANDNKVNLEDLNIFVELEVYDRPDDIIIHNNISNIDSVKVDNQENIKFKFVDSSFDGKKKTNLNTNYTDLNTRLNAPNDNLGSLGIEQIDISFNTSYTPVVKIRMRDVRGKLFELGKDSPYSFLFKIPYPIFYLTIKGYLGKPVKFALHLLKFNSEFDSETGSFILNCEFIGYTYAFLSDMLMSYLAAAPCTEEGKKLLPPGFKDFNHYTTEIQTLKKVIGKYKDSNKKLKSLTILVDLLDKLNELKRLTLDTISSLESSTKGKVFRDSQIKDSGYVVFGNSNNYTKADLKNDEANYKRAILDKVDEFNNFNKTRESDQFILDKTKFELKPTGVFYSSKTKNDLLVSWEDYNSNSSNLISNFLEVSSPLSTATTVNDDNIIIKNKYNDLRILLGGNLSTHFYGTNPILNIFDFRYVMLDIENQINEIIKLEDKYKKEVNQDFIEYITDNVNLDLSIGGIIKLLCDHSDLFLSILENIGIAAKTDSDNRTFKLLDNEKFTEYSHLATDTKIKAFPEYKEKNEDGVFEEKWIGANRRYENLPEVKFIENLYKCITNRNPDEPTGSDSSSEYSWYPVNILDTKILNTRQENPWKIANNSSDNEIFKLMTQRMILFLGYSNKFLDDDEVITMAKLEANQAHKNIINDVIKKSIINADYPEDEQSIDNRISLIDGKVKEQYGISLEINDSSTAFRYVDNIGGLTNDSLIATGEVALTYLPISQPLSYLKNRANGLTQFGADVSGRINHGKSNPFGSELVNNESEVNGETYIKIINHSQYRQNDKYYNYDIDAAVLDEANYLTSNISEFELTDDVGINKSNDLFGGSYKIHEFFKYQSLDNGEIDMAYEFYNNNSLAPKVKTNRGDEITSKYDTFTNAMPIPCDTAEKIEDLNTKTKVSLNNFKSSIINNLKDTDFKINPTFNSKEKEYNLFGSDFYYSQDIEEARALLFLHTIPFEGMDRGSALRGKGLLESKVKKMFNQRSGAIEVPTSWALFLGGLLHRQSLPDDIIRFVGDNNVSLIPNINNISTINVNNYLAYGVPDDDEIRGGDSYSMSFSDFYGGTKGTKLYHTISDVINRLPKSVKAEFINLFTTWVNDGDGWLKIKEQYEIFGSAAQGMSGQDTRLDVWKDITQFIGNANVIKDTAINNYNIISRSKVYNDKNRLNRAIPQNNEEFFTEIRETGTQALGGGSPVNFYLELKNDSEANRVMKDFLINDKKIIINSTWRIWVGSEDSQLPITVSAFQVKEYMRAFLLEFKKLNGNIVEGEPIDKTERLFKSSNTDDVKLNLYKNVKSIYDKWVIGNDGTNVDIVTKKLFKHFIFIDKAFNDISSKFKIGPNTIANELKTTANTSLYNFIANLLKDNNFDFIPLPTYIEYDNVESVSDVFKPKIFNENVISGPQFICMYIGERSNKLDIVDPKTKQNKNDGVFICNTEDVPDEYKENNIKRIPYFLVNYSDQQQSIFSKFTLNQQEFTETDEGLAIIEDISSKTEVSAGQNLFDIYNNRSYSAKIDMLGAAQIQPFMNFQLNNIPMFNGAYTVINVNHTITPNNMKTSFKGVRIRKGLTKFVTDETLYLNLIGNLNEVDNSDASIRDLTYTPTQQERLAEGNNIANSHLIPEFNFINPLPLNSDNKLIVTSYYGPRAANPANWHGGIDFRANVGTNVLSIGDGEVYRIRLQEGSAGLYIDIKYGDWYMSYMHLSDIEDKMFGDDISLSEFGNATDINIFPTKNGNPIKVARGEVMGLSGGKEGDLFAGSSRGPHLHVQLRDTVNIVRDELKNPSVILPSHEWGYTTAQITNEQ